ncbi:hypothetical protein DFH29DRAFT_1040222 [Suillus ampliporus]|nr:hypothetical protein DFH29DRAFT_1040222 [Suillus ampliporus]
MNSSVVVMSLSIFHSHPLMIFALLSHCRLLLCMLAETTTAHCLILSSNAQLLSAQIQVMHNACKYVTGKHTSHLKRAMKHFQWASGPGVWPAIPIIQQLLPTSCGPCLEGYSRSDLQDIDSTTSLFRDALTLRPQGHPDHP